MTSKDLLQQTMIDAALPLVAERIRQSPEYATVIQKLAAIDTAVTEARVALAEFLSDHGLSAVVEDVKEAQAKAE